MQIQWTLTSVEEAKGILSVLAKLPYEQVAELIHRLRAQTEEQLHPEARPEVAAPETPAS